MTNRPSAARARSRLLVLAAVLSGPAVSAQLTLVADIVPGVGNSEPHELTPFFGRTLFTASDGGSERDLWITNGFPGGTFKLFDGIVQQVEVAGDYGVFRVFPQGDLYRTDGSVAGTQLLWSPPGSLYSFEAVYRGQVYFSEFDLTNGATWRTDGETVEKVADHAVWGYPGMAGTRDSLYYLATGLGSQPSGLWRLDRGDPASRPQLIQAATMSLLGAWVVAGDDRVFWSSGDSRVWSLTETVGRPSLPAMVFDSLDPAHSPAAPYVDGGRLYFAGYTAASGEEPWISDGTPSTTQIVLDMWPGTGSSAPAGFVRQTTRIVFFADTPSTGREPWWTDGAATSTGLLKDINPGTASSCGSFTRMAMTGSRIGYFGADDGTTGWELWRSTGYSAARKINLGLPDPVSSFPGAQYMATNDGALLFTATDPTFGRELWRLQLTASSHPMGVSCADGRRYPTLYATDPELGVWTDVSVRDLAAGTSLVLFLDRKLRSPLAYGSRCTRFYAATTTYLILPLPTGDLDLRLPLPNDPSLAGLVLAAQGLAFPTPLGFDTTNGFELALGY